MIRRYPTIFKLFSIPNPPTPYVPSSTLPALSLSFASLTPPAVALAKKESALKKSIPACQLLLPRLCNDHLDKFKVVEASYGRALELVSWDNSLAKALPWHDEDESLELIVDRPLKFKHLRLRKELNIKKWHHDYLIKFKEFLDVCPYISNLKELVKELIRAGKTACGVVREVLGMTME
ncbi:protein WHAT'S THIS FACTOR 1, chloroplastic-like [Salvia miltiorrhiza]|uniref:protein WHAT'S THIS FACTOR 1, chloroplastic-like n=1 Tax=Salvia miltiorrhiza TaxID=226208 RepID=UPI0025AD319F|nr:protein WHAT'S THIS FACTOR 1, chloroplastic-like [Salvia miltiorrhiza]